MDRHVFNFKFAAKQMAKNSSKCEKNHQIEKDKCKKAIIRGNMEIAKIHAENAIREQNQSINFLTMSARLDSVAHRVQYASTMQRVSRSLQTVTKSMENALKSMNLEKLCELLDIFESECLDLDVHATTMENAMQQSSTGFYNQNEVDRFLQQTAEEAGLDIGLELPSAGASLPASGSLSKDELQERFQTLKNK